jgi:hypothetical protein
MRLKVQIYALACLIPKLTPSKLIATISHKYTMYWVLKLQDRHLSTNSTKFLNPTVFMSIIAIFQSLPTGCPPEAASLPSTETE